MTQEALAEKSGLSAREIRRLERGKGDGGKGHRPRPSTVAYLADAMALPVPERRIFEEAALHPAGDGGLEPPVPRSPAANRPSR